MKTQKLMQTLFLLHTNMTVPAIAALYPGQPLGRRFPCATLKQCVFTGKPMEENQVARLTWQCEEYLTFGTDTGGTAGLPNWLLYDANLAGLPALS